MVINKITSSSGNLPPVLLDLTNDTVRERNLEKDQTAHNAEGYQITGEMSIENAEAWAVGQRNGVDVGSEDITYHNNSKYYSTVSGSIMRMAGEQAQSAATNANNAYNSANAAYESAVISGSCMRIAQVSAEDAEHSSIISGSSMRIAQASAEEAEYWAHQAESLASGIHPLEGYYNNADGKFYRYYYEYLQFYFSDEKTPSDLTMKAFFAEGHYSNERYLIHSNYPGFNPDIPLVYFYIIYSDGTTFTTDSSISPVDPSYEFLDDQYYYDEYSKKVFFEGHNEHSFSYSEELEKTTNAIYRDLFSNNRYMWDGTKFRILVDDESYSIAIPIFKGVSGSILSVSGLVPPSQPGDEHSVFTGNGQWTALDSTPTQNSEAPINSGGVYDVLQPINGSIASIGGQVDDLEDTSVTWEQQNVLGAKNFIVPRYGYDYDYESTTTDMVLSFKADGSIIINGTNTNTNEDGDYWTTSSIITLPIGTYKFSDALTGGQIEKPIDTENNRPYWITYIQAKINGTWTFVAGEDSENNYQWVDEFVLTEPTQLRGRVLFYYPGYTFINQGLYPMVRLASIEDDTWEPYASTNKELTDRALPSNPNLLDNPFFTVNQRGVTTFGTETSTKSEYGVDRWKARYILATVQNDGSILISKSANTGKFGYLSQRFLVSDVSYLLGKTVTVSVNISNINITNGIAFITFQNMSSANNNNTDIAYIPAGEVHNGINTFTFTIPSTLANNYIGLSIGFYDPDGETVSGSFVVKSAKLEIGDKSTLAMDTAPNYETELIKCMRYFQRYKSFGGEQCLKMGLGIVRTTKRAEINGNLIVPLRAVPSVTASGTFSIMVGNTFYNFTQGTEATMQYNSNTASLGIIALLIDFVTAPGFTVGDACALNGSKDASNYIDFNAEI